ncbi:hypothetical protein WKI45_04465 [Delftia tsuruhatensis]
MIEEIKKQILLKYRSLYEPNYSEVCVPTNESIALRNELKKIAEIIDVTDENNDVGFILSVKGNLANYTLMISWVGNYVAILGHLGNSMMQAISENGKDELLNKLINKIKSSGFYILDDNLLRKSIDFVSINSDEDKTRIYKILFTDDDIDFG